MPQFAWLASHRGALLAGLALVLSSCSTGGERQPDSQNLVKASVPVQASIFFSSARRAELEPCGCSLAPMGGVDREATLIQKWRAVPNRQFLHVEGGATFLPKLNEAKNLKDYQSKAGYLADALNKLGVSVLAPGTEDLQLGAASLQELEKRGKFTLVSSNLYTAKGDKPVFQTAYRWLGPQGTVTVIALLSKRDAKAAPGFKIKAPEAAVGEVLKNLGDAPGFIVLVSMLNQDELENIVGKFPQIRAVLDASRSLPDYSPQLLAAGTVLIRPFDRGRQIANLTFDLSHDSNALYNEWLYDHYRTSIYNSEAHIEAMQARLKLAKSSKEKRILKQEVATSKQSIEDDKARIAADPKNAIKFDYQVAFIDGKSLEQNPELTNIINAYKTSLRETAVDSASDSSAN